MDPTQLKSAVVAAITLPSRLDNESGVVREPVGDACMLRCGCVVSETLVDQVVRRGNESKCPICGYSPCEVVGPVDQLRDLFRALGLRKREEPKFSDLSPIVSVGTTATKEPVKKESLMSLFYSVANTVIQEPPSPQTFIEPPTQKVIEFHQYKPRSAASRSSSIVSNNTVPLVFPTKQITDSSSTTGRTSSSIQTPPHGSSQLTSPPPSTQEPYQEHKEYLFVKCFPKYRRHYQFGTHSKFLKAKSRTFIQSKISPSCKYFVLLSPKKWEVYEIPQDSSKPPVLYCCGKSTGEFGPNFENLSKPPMDEIRSGNVTAPDFLKKLTDWEHLYCSLSDTLLVISGTNGIFRVYDLTLRGRPIYLYSSNFPIRCIDICPSSQLIAYGITGKDRLSGTEQALIVMHKLLFNGEFLVKVDPVTITFPYRDPINTVSFSSDSNYLSCSTALESRFLTVLVKDADKPKLVMKSIRSLDTSLESEGITAIKMFDNNRYMCVTSVAFGAPPIIIDNNIALTNGLQTVAQPKMLLKLDEVGTSIHDCAVSPRNDSVALLDRDGTVYLMTATTMDQESKRVFIVDQVNHAFRARESASLVFSKDGHRLYIVDRKGVLYVNDFAAGTPQNSEITRCKPLIRD